MADQVVERFKPTSGRIVGTVGLVFLAAVVVIGLVDADSGFGGAVLAGAVVLGVLTWASTLRPAMWVTRDSLVMRNMLETVTIPLAGIEQVAVQQVTAVRAGDRRYVSPVVGRALRHVIRGRRAEQATAVPASYPDHVEQRIRTLAADAAAARGIRPLSDEQLAVGREVVRRPAWLEIGLLAAAVVGFVLALVL